MEFKEFKHKYVDGFLADELISHDSDQFLYITDLHGFLWKIIRTFNPGASGTLDDYADSIIPELDTLRKELAEVTKERDEAQKELAKLHDILSDMPCSIDELLEDDNGEH